MRILTVVGARPQFIKAAAMSRILRGEHEEILVHTGQHHDAQMSDVFFDELHIPKPDYNLGIAGGSHADMTARMLIALEEVLVKEKPDALLVYGDTNSTLAAALAAVKLHVPVLHVEAGNRFGSFISPEEVNRVLTDRISSMLFACVPSALRFLEDEGLGSRSYLVGDPMYDAFEYYRNLNGGRLPETLTDIDGEPVSVPKRFNYLTCHREENTRDEASLSEILLAVEERGIPALYPVHPRNRAMAMALRGRLGLRNIIMLSPVGYLESIALVAGAERIVTDSGGVQREAFFAGVPCVTVLNYAAWPETLVDGRNALAKPERADIASKLAAEQTLDPKLLPFGDGHACEKIVRLISESGANFAF